MKTLKLQALVAVSGKLAEKNRLWSLSYIITGGAAPLLFSVKQIALKTWRACRHLRDN